MSESGVRFKVLDLPESVVGECLLVEGGYGSDDHKAKLLKRLGVERLDGEGYLAAWLRHIAETNGLPVTVPAHPDIADAICMDRDASRIMWILA